MCFHPVHPLLNPIKVFLDCLTTVFIVHVREIRGVFINWGWNFREYLLKRWQINCTATVDIKYPSRTSTLLFSHAGKDIHFEEGLLWVLQESGWIFPYEGSWEWTIYSDDYRLK